MYEELKNRLASLESKVNSMESRLHDVKLKADAVKALAESALALAQSAYPAETLRDRVADLEALVGWLQAKVGQPKQKKPAEVVIDSVNEEGVVEVTQVRVSGSWHPLSHSWAEVKLQVHHPDGTVDYLEHEEFRVARRYSGSGEGRREAPELQVVALLKHYLSAHGVKVMGLRQYEHRTHPNGDETWYYWAHLGARFGVAMTQPRDWVVEFVGLN